MYIIADKIYREKFIHKIRKMKFLSTTVLCVVVSFIYCKEFNSRLRGQLIWKMTPSLEEYTPNEILIKASMVFAIDKNWKILCCGSLFEPDLALFPEECHTEMHAHTIVVQHRELRMSARYYISLGIKPIGSLAEGIVTLKLEEGVTCEYWPPAVGRLYYNVEKIPIGSHVYGVGLLIQTMQPILKVFEVTETTDHLITVKKCPGQPIPELPGEPLYYGNNIAGLYFENGFEENTFVFKRAVPLIDVFG